MVIISVKKSYNHKFKLWLWRFKKNQMVWNYGPDSWLFVLIQLVWTLLNLVTLTESLLTNLPTASPCQWFEYQMTISKNPANISWTILEPFHKKGKCGQYTSEWTIKMSKWAIWVERELVWKRTFCFSLNWTPWQSPKSKPGILHHESSQASWICAKS